MEAVVEDRLEPELAALSTADNLLRGRRDY